MSAAVGGWQDAMKTHFWDSVRSEPQNNLDVTLVAKNGSVKAHKFILENVSVVLKQIVQTLPFAIGDQLMIIAPDFSVEAIRCVLQLIYVGTINISTMAKFDEASEFAARHLGINLNINFSSIPTESRERKRVASEQATGSKVEQIEVPVSSIAVKSEPIGEKRKPAENPVKQVPIVVQLVQPDQPVQPTRGRFVFLAPKENKGASSGYAPKQSQYEFGIDSDEEMFEEPTRTNQDAKVETVIANPINNGEPHYDVASAKAIKKERM